MKYLLDTHAFLWFINDDKQLSTKATNAIVDPTAIKYVSIAVFWEVAIKLNIGKLKIGMSFEELWHQMERNGFEVLPVTFEHTFELSSLDWHHKDPFDRMMIARAIVEDFCMISKDSNFVNYNGLKLLW